MNENIPATGIEIQMKIPEFYNFTFYAKWGFYFFGEFWIVGLKLQIYPETFRMSHKNSLQINVVVITKEFVSFLMFPISVAGAIQWSQMIDSHGDSVSAHLWAT